MSISIRGCTNFISRLHDTYVFSRKSLHGMSTVARTPLGASLGVATAGQLRGSFAGNFRLAPSGLNAGLTAGVPLRIHFGTREP